MSRIKKGVQAKYKHKKILKKAKGYYGARSRCFRTAKQAVIKAHQYAYRDRRQKKRVFRSKWISMINLALSNSNCKINYSTFIHSLKVNKIFLNRKVLADIAMNNISDFYNLVKKIQILNNI